MILCLANSVGCSSRSTDVLHTCILCFAELQQPKWQAKWRGSDLITRWEGKGWAVGYQGRLLGIEGSVSPRTSSNVHFGMSGSLMALRLQWLFIFSGAIPTSAKYRCWLAPTSFLPLIEFLLMESSLFYSFLMERDIIWVSVRFCGFASSWFWFLFKAVCLSNPGEMNSNESAAMRSALRSTSTPSYSCAGAHLFVACMNNLRRVFSSLENLIKTENSLRSWIGTCVKMVTTVCPSLWDEPGLLF